MKRRKGLLAAGVCAIVASAVFWSFFWSGRALPVLNRTAPETKAAVVIDAGHGGFDPGKVGTSGTLEKDINLAIAHKIKERLEDSGYKVYMTRDSDTSLDDGTSGKRKTADLKKRVEIIEQAEPALAVSIHQNSYSAGTKGAQVFYYSASEESGRLASVMQNTIREMIGDGNRRVEKANDSYYMLKQTTCPFVIVECGFLSNPQEEQLLKDTEYQQKMAAAICEGIENFLYK